MPDYFGTFSIKELMLEILNFKIISSFEILVLYWINLFRVNVPFIKPQKASENKKFSDVFKWVQKEHIGMEMVNESTLTLNSNFTKKLTTIYS